MYGQRIHSRKDKSAECGGVECGRDVNMLDGEWSLLFPATNPQKVVGAQGKWRIQTTNLTEVLH